MNKPVANIIFFLRNIFWQYLEVKHLSLSLFRSLSSWTYQRKSGLLWKELCIVCILSDWTGYVSQVKLSTPQRPFLFGFEFFGLKSDSFSFIIDNQCCSHLFEDFGLLWCRSAQTVTQTDTNWHKHFSTRLGDITLFQWLYRNPSLVSPFRFAGLDYETLDHETATWSSTWDVGAPISGRASEFTIKSRVSNVFLLQEAANWRR